MSNVCCHVRVRALGIFPLLLPPALPAEISMRLFSLLEAFGIILFLHYHPLIWKSILWEGSRVQ